ncbi:invasin domain 3-containing protein, partial [Cellulomonas denverensis]
MANNQVLPSPFEYDEYKLWGGRADFSYTYPLTENSAQGVVSGSRRAPVMTVGARMLSGEPMSTLAVDGGGLNGERTPRLYAWSWNASRTTSSWPSGSPTSSATSYIPIASYDDGQTTGKAHFVPLPSVSSGLSTSYDYWSGGEVYQKTGELYLSSGECAGINRSFRVAIYDPSTGTTRGSATLVPNTGADDIFGTTDPCGNNGYVASDMAIDAEGNFYILVRGASDRQYLVRVVPGEDKAEWRYNVVGQLQTSTGSAFTNTNGFWGMAFHNGNLYLQGETASRQYRFDPLSLRLQDSSFTDPAQTQDLAAAQTAPVLDGVVYDDANGNGVVDAGETGLADQTVALYDEDGALLGTRQTDGAGNYSFILNAIGTDYHVRLVQPQVNGVNAVQTHAAGGSSGPSNSVTARCAGGDLTNTSGACSGQLAGPAADPALGALGSTVDLDAMPILTTATVRTANEVTTADFGVHATTTASWGDAPFSSTAAQQGPRLYDYDGTGLRLGETRGDYADGSTANDHATDDGVSIAGPNGAASLANGVLAVGGQYDLLGQVQGGGAEQATVSTWLARTNGATDFRTGAIAATGTAGTAAAHYPYAGAGDAAVSLTVPDSTGDLSSTWLRAAVSDQALADPDNTASAYQPAKGSAEAASNPWVLRGEVEDYQVHVAQGVIRIAATSQGQVADGDYGYELTGPVSTTAPSSTSATVRPAEADTLTYADSVHALSALGEDVTVTATTVPARWAPTSARVVDTFTGATVEGATVDLSTGAVTVPGSALARGADVTVEFSYATGPNASASSWQVLPTRVVADGVAEATATATIRDGRGLPYSGAEVSFTVPEGVELSPVTDHGDGTYTATLRSTTAMDATVQAFVAATDGVQPLPDSPRTVTFVAGEPAVGEGLSSVSIDDQSPRAADNQAYHLVTAVLRDAHGNAVTGAQGALAGTGPAGVTVDAFTEAEPGVYNARVRSTVAGSLPVTVSYAGSLELGTVTAVYAAGGPDLSEGASALRAEATGDRGVSDPATVSVGDAEHVHTAAVTLVDAQGNPVPDYPVDFAVSDPALVGLGGSMTVSTDADGVARLHLATSTSGTYLVTASVGGQPVLPAAGVRFTFVPGAAVTTPGGTEIGASTGTRPADGQTSHWVEVLAKDSFGNAVPGAQIAFALPQGLTAAGSVSGVTGEAGTLRLLVTSTTAGSYPVTATVDGQPIQNGSPATVTFVAGTASATASNWSVTPDGALPVGEQFTATVQLNDASGNPVGAGEEVTFSVPAGVSVIESGPYLTGDDGRVVVHLTSTVAGRYEVSAQLGGQRIGAARTLEFIAGAPVVGDNGSALSASTGAVEADGERTHWIEVLAVDAYRNPVPGAEVALALPRELILVDGAATGSTGANGRYRVLVASTVAGSHQVTATVAGQQITAGSPATVVFAAGAPDAGRSSWSITPDTAQPIGARFTATVQLNDATGNPVAAGAEVAFTLADGLRIVEQGPYLSDGSGRVVVHLTADRAGSYPVSAAVGADRIGTERELVFTPGEVSATESGLTATTPVLADGRATSAVVVTLRDVNGDPVVGTHEVRVTSTVGSVGTVRDLGDGRYTTTISSLTAGRAEVGFVVDGVAGVPTAAVDFVAAPSTPVLDPSNGWQVTGRIDPGATAQLTDADGTALTGTLAVDPEGGFVFTPVERLAHGTEVVVTAVDGHGFESDPASVVVDAKNPARPVVPPTRGVVVEVREVEEGATPSIRDTATQQVIPGEWENTGGGIWLFTPDVPLTEQDSTEA